MVKITSSVHTRIANSLGIRKEILEAELKTMELLQNLKKLKREKEEKINLIAQFKKEISAVSDAIQRLEFQDLPTDMEKKEMKKVPVEKPQKKIKEEIEESIVDDEMAQEVEDLKEKIEALKI